MPKKEPPQDYYCELGKCYPIEPKPKPPKNPYGHMNTANQGKPYKVGYTITQTESEYKFDVYCEFDTKDVQISIIGNQVAIKPARVALTEAPQHVKDRIKDGGHFVMDIPKRANPEGMTFKVRQLKDPPCRVRPTEQGLWITMQKISSPAA